jgi:hypothetical protein
MILQVAIYDSKLNLKSLAPSALDNRPGRCVGRRWEDPTLHTHMQASAGGPQAWDTHPSDMSSTRETPASGMSSTYGTHRVCWRNATHCNNPFAWRTVWSLMRGVRSMCQWPNVTWHIRWSDSYYYYAGKKRKSVDGKGRGRRGTGPRILRKANKATTVAAHWRMKEE